jgi:hypothetical protein
VFTEGIGVLTESIGVFIVCICGRSSCLIICCYFRLSLCSTITNLLIWTVIADIFVIEFCSSQIMPFLLKLRFSSLGYSWSKLILVILFNTLCVPAPNEVHNNLALKYFSIWRTWWRSFPKCVVYT